MLSSNLLDKFRIKGAPGPGDSRELHSAGGFSAQYYFDRALDLVSKELFADAIDALKKAIAQRPDFTEAYCEMGTTYCRLGRFSDAINSYNSALTMDPNSIDVYDQLAATYDLADQPIEAIKVCMKAMRLHPRATDIRNTLGKAYFNIGSYAEALKAHQQVIKMRPDDATAHYCLGVIYMDLQDKDSALQEQKALDDFGHSEMAAQLLDEIHWQFSGRRSTPILESPPPISA
jgi:tetratricopeptide (TPR) repeat protein